MSTDVNNLSSDVNKGTIANFRKSYYSIANVYKSTIDQNKKAPDINSDEHH